MLALAKFLFVLLCVHGEQEEFELAYQAAKAAGVEPNGIMDAADDPSRMSVVRWVMNNSHCGWLIGKGGSGIQNIEVRG